MPSRKKKRSLSPPTSTGDEGGYVFESRHPSKKFANILSQLRIQYPPEVWSTICKLYPNRKATNPPPLAVDIAVGVEGRGGVELARQGFHVIGVEADAQLLARTFQFAQQHNSPIELMTAKVEKSLVHDDSADLVTFFHGLHLVDTSAALQEAWRMLKPGAKLIAAWNDRDLSSLFMRELEDIMEQHILNYNRFQKQRAVDIWSERLTEGHLFRLIEYAVHPNPIKMRSPSSLLDVLDCMSFVRANLKGPNRKSFNNDVRALLERRFDHHSFDLPLETKIYVLEKVSEEERRNGKKKNPHHHGGGKKLNEGDEEEKKEGRHHQHHAATTETIFTN
ncbi:hypothetical protein Ndes2526B_g01723 [Nannochloris sp. 'desiccata']